MKKTLLFLAITALMTAGCSRTWSGVKQDTSEVFQDTKEVIHEATA
ncbi:MAG TPA: entericidin EcnAB [Epsilonproteobacteria bacterium]|nr:entericidin EcnAB [Campylobacterota bacterium]